MTVLPERPAVMLESSGPDGLRAVVQGLLVHRDWVAAYGITDHDVRLGEQNLRSTVDVIDRALEISDAPIAVAREPIERVQGICRHFALLHTALLRSQGVPARVRCGFGNYFDPAKWYDHWITERWNGERWVRDDPQVDGLQRTVVNLAFDPYDQPPGRFLTGAEAWVAARAGDVDPDLFGIFDMWGLKYISGNVISDFACINKVELLPWDGWGMMTGPHEPLTTDALAVLDVLAALVVTDDFEAVRERYLNDDRLRVPADITSFIDGELIDVHLDLW